MVLAKFDLLKCLPSTLLFFSPSAGDSQAERGRHIKTTGVSFLPCFEHQRRPLFHQIRSPLFQQIYSLLAFWGCRVLISPLQSRAARLGDTIRCENNLPLRCIPHIFQIWSKHILALLPLPRPSIHLALVLLACTCFLRSNCQSVRWAVLESSYRQLANMGRRSGIGCRSAFCFLSFAALIPCRKE